MKEITTSHSKNVLLDCISAENRLFVGNASALYSKHKRCQRKVAKQAVWYYLWPDMRH